MNSAHNSLTYSLPRSNNATGTKVLDRIMKVNAMDCIIGLLVLGLAGFADADNISNPSEIPGAPGDADGALILFPQVNYDVTVSDQQARFRVNLTADSAARQGAAALLFEGELALLPAKLPAGVRLEREGNRYFLWIQRPGRQQVDLELVAKVTHADPWNLLSFQGPAAVISSISARATGADVDLQLLTGTLLSTSQSNDVSRVKGVLGSDRTVSLRWSRARAATDLSRQAVITAETEINAQITPTVIKYATQLRYEILQGKVSLLQIRLPANVALTRLVGEQVRDWQIRAGSESNGWQTLEVQLIKPVEKQYQLTLFAEQALETAASAATLSPPQPIQIERESGSLSISAEDTLSEVESATGLRQVNAAAAALAAYRFNTRPFAVTLKLRRIEPLLTVAERVSARLEETRLLSTHSLSLKVEKAGVYGLDLRLPPGFLAAEVRGEGIEDWKVTQPSNEEHRILRVNFNSRVLGSRRLEVQLEQAFKSFPEQVRLGPMRIVGVSKESSELGAASAAGIRLKTAALAGLREVPVRTLQNRTNADELLGYKSEQSDWQLTLAAERLAPRVVAEIFNLVTIGDGLVGGSATVRFGLINQGVQEFNFSLPPTWKNVEFTGANIRRKDRKSDGTWTIGLQDKAWGAYTLVVTYDYQFDPKGAVLPMGGLHVLGAERETGSIAITTAASLKLNAATVSGALQRLDEMELAAPDRALITRAVLLAYEYDQKDYTLEVEVKRFSELSVLSAVADRTQLTTVLTDTGEMLTQASFMVKNNDKQFQRFKLPRGAKFWSCHVNGQAVKVDRDKTWLMVPLPRGANRDQAFAVDIVYAEARNVQPGLRPRTFALEAPQTDVPNTYAEWQLFAPAAFRLSGFAGNMTPVRGTTYGLQDAWQKFTRFYWDFLREAGSGIFMGLLLIFLMVALIGSAIRRGSSGVISVLVVFAIIAILSAMLLPALSRAKSKAQRITAMNSLKQIGLAARTFALDNNDRLPNSFEEMMSELSTDKITYDPESGQRFVYLGAGLEFQKIQPDSIIAYSPVETGGYRAVLLADGSVDQLNSRRFEERSRLGWILPATAQQIVQNQQVAAVRGAQLQPATAQVLPATPAPIPGANPIPAVQSSDAAPAVARARSIRIEIPREGQAFAFTKVLNVGREPLAVQVNLMKLQTFQAFQASLQLAAFLCGLAICWRQWRRARNTFFLTLGIALILGALGNLLLTWRMLHLAFIWTAPIFVLAFLAWITWKLWPRPQEKKLAPNTGLEPGLPPAVAGLLFLLMCGTANPMGAAEPARTEPAAAPGVSAKPIAPMNRNVSILSAAYAGSVNEQVAQLEVSLKLSSAQPGQKVWLFDQDVAVRQFSVRAGEGRLVREGTGVAVILPRRGDTILELKLLVKLGGDISRRQLAFAIPSALSSQLALTIEQPEADVEFPAAISLQRSTAGQHTRVEAMIGAADRVELLWTPRVKRAAEITANIICHNTSLVTLGNGVVNVRAVLQFQVTQGEMRQARVRLPAGQRLLRVEGDGIRTWELSPLAQVTSPSGSDDQLLSVELTKGVAPEYRLTLETERLLETLPATTRPEIPHAVEVKRETGLLGLRADEELELAIENAADLYRVDADEFVRAYGPGASSALNAFRFLRPDSSLLVRVAPMQPQIEAKVHNALRLAQDQVTLTATIDYDIKRAGIFGLKLILPEGYRLENLSGKNILQSLDRVENGAQSLEVTLRERTLGSYQLKLELVRTLKELPTNLDLAGVHPLDIHKLTGFVSVSVEPGVAVKASGFEGLTEIPAASIGASEGAGGGIVLAYKFLSTESQMASGWKLSVVTEAVESWIRAEIVSTLTLADTIINGRALARFEIQNAPVKELRLKIPASFRNVEISAPNIRRRDHDGEQWRIEFQSKIRGTYLVTVTWDEPRDTRTNYVGLRGIAAENVERETGVLAVVAKPPLQVTPRESGELKPIDLRDLPEWAGPPHEATVLAYRYLRPGYALGLDALRLDQAQVLQTLVESLKLSTVVADDGQMMTEMILSVKNQGQQHLEIGLPAGTTVWSAFVAGQAVRPSVKDGKLLLPLEQSIGDDAPIAIDLVYIGTNRFPLKRGTMELVSPRLDAPLKSARWELFLPPDYHYSEFGGTMAHEVETAMLEASSFSFLDYSSRESQSKAELAKEWKSEIVSAKKKLSKGNVKEALADYNRARAKGDLAAKDTETQQLETDLRRAQGNNLIQAQNNFAFNNSGGRNETMPLPVTTPNTDYDPAAAEAQWAKLQQAQDLVMAKVQPIRVNLPTRGLRHGFTQVLQTEPGKPVTIRLLARNGRVAGWPQRILGPLIGFLVLWASVAFGTHLWPPRKKTVPI